MLALGFGTQEALIVAGIVILLFGAKKLPELGRSFGEGLREFKKSTRGIVDDEEPPKKEDVPVNKEEAPSKE